MYRIRLTKKEEVAHKTLLFSFEKPSDFDFTAGQYVSMKALKEVFDDEKGNRRVFSIASAPYEKELQFCWRQSESGFKKNMDALDIGEQVEITQPVGKFILPEEESKRKIVFIAAGVGITPVRSILRQAQFAKRDEDFYLFFSNRIPSSAPFLDEFARFDAISLTTIHTMTDEVFDEPWGGERGFICVDMLNRHVVCDDRALFYTVGTAGFIKAMKAMLLSMNVSEERILFDNFG